MIEDHNSKFKPLPARFGKLFSASNLGIDQPDLIHRQSPHQAIDIMCHDCHIIQHYSRIDPSSFPLKSIALGSMAVGLRAVSTLLVEN